MCIPSEADIRTNTREGFLDKLVCWVEIFADVLHRYRSQEHSLYPNPPTAVYPIIHLPVRLSMGDFDASPYHPLVRATVCSFDRSLIVHAKLFHPYACLSVRPSVRHETPLLNR